MAASRTSFDYLGADTMLRQVKAMSREIAGVRAGEDIECLHRMRVASRRLRAALRLFKGSLADPGRHWRKPIRRVTRALSRARDLDVQIETVRGLKAAMRNKRLRPGLKRLLRRLRQERARLQSKVIQALHRLSASKTLPEMRRKPASNVSQHRIPDEKAPARVYLEAYDSLMPLLKNMLAYEGHIYRPECIEEMHRMRIAAKRLRYAMEIFAPAYGEALQEPIRRVKRVQTLLGEIHDCDVWAARLPEFLEEERRRTVSRLGHDRPLAKLAPGVAYLQANRRRRRTRLYRTFLKQWGIWRDEAAWQALARELHRRVPGGIAQSASSAARRKAPGASI